MAATVLGLLLVLENVRKSCENASTVGDSFFGRLRLAAALREDLGVDSTGRARGY
ncbi:hypothetical protein [Anaeromyxobacter oryzae]|uniref:hypothetical protein n=1 Tax=Anaeromyxobacter oryzae TaxID=2918170 RepID=UPI0020C0A5EC|nr:hypothetical protein [Anaeromyxobacter oryzae]